MTDPDNKGPVISSSKEKKTKRWFRFSSIIETLAALAFILFLNKVFLPQYHGFVSVHPHPFWLIVILISVRYGFKESIASALLISAVYFLYVFFPAHGEFYFSTLKLFNQFKEPILFLIVSGVISEYTDHLNKRNEWLQDQLQIRKKEIDILDEKNIAQIESLKILENRIVTRLSNVNDLINDLSRAKQFSAEEIIVNLLDTCIKYMEIDSCSFWVINKNRYECKVQRGGINNDIPAESDRVLMDAWKNKRVTTASEYIQAAGEDMEYSISYIAGPVLTNTGECRGVVRVEAMSFIKYNPFTFKLFQTILELWGTALDERKQLDYMHKQSIFNEELGLYNYFYFQARVEQEFNRAKEYSFPLSLSLIRIEDYDNIRLEGARGLRMTIARMFTDGATELDMVSIYKDDDTIAVVFPCMAAVDAQKKIDDVLKKIKAFEFQPYSNKEKHLSLKSFTADYRIGMKTFDDLIDIAEEGLNKTGEGKK